MNVEENIEGCLRYTTYHEGKIIKRNYYRSFYITEDTFSQVTEYYLQDNIRRTIRDYNTEEILYIYDISQAKQILNGSFTFYESDKPKYQAIFKNGKLIDGTVALRNYYTLPFHNKSNYKDENYMTMSINKNTVIFTFYDKNNNELQREIKNINGVRDLLDNVIKLEDLYPFDMFNKTIK